VSGDTGLDFARWRGRVLRGGTSIQECATALFPETASVRNRFSRSPLSADNYGHDGEENA